MYLKIVPAIPSADNLFLECRRFDYRVEYGAASDVSERCREFVTPPNVDGGFVTGVEPQFKSIVSGYTREVVEPSDGNVAAICITAYIDDAPITFIAAYESTVYVMNDKGVTIDRIHAICKFGAA